jgi:hypothetical protein
MPEHSLKRGPTKPLIEQPIPGGIRRMISLIAWYSIAVTENG